MSISTVALNAGILGMYGYQLYNLYQAKSERPNSQLALAVEANIDPVNDDPLLQREIENELKPLIGNKQLILRDARHLNLKPEVATASATLTMPTSKEIVVNLDFYKKDKEACKALVKWSVQWEAEMCDYLYTRLLVKSFGQVAATALSVSENWSLLTTLGLTFFLQNMICPAISNCLQSPPNSIIATSSPNELIAARRIFKVFKNLYKRTSYPRAKEVEIKNIKECIRDINRYIKVRKVEIDFEEEEKKIQSLQDYLQPYINLELKSCR